MIGDEIRYVPAGKKTTAPEMVVEPQAWPHLFPSVTAALIAAVSRVEGLAKYHMSQNAGDNADHQ
jgi:hypothetical protein